MPEILIVEDNLLNLTIEVDLLRSFGYEPKKAKNGQEALKVLDEAKIDLVLLDMELPKVSGLEVLKRIKNGPETWNTRVVAVTGYTDHESERQFLEAGCFAVLSKPINFCLFRSQIEEFLSDCDDFS